MEGEIIHFQTSDYIKLSGILYKAKTNNKKILISTHGMATDCLKYRDEKIAEEIEKIQTDMLVYNNRGKEIISYIKTEKGEKKLGGTAFEDVEESYYDIVGAIEFAKKQGYKEIYLMGHSLGATKTVYTYNKLIDENKKEILENIKGIILLSLVDIPTATRIYLNERFPEILTYAKNMEREKMENILMPEKTFIHPISVKTFLKYARDYQKIDFARYSEKEYNFETLNKIEVPLMMRWGNVNELILQKPEDLCKMLNEKITNTKKDIGYIDGANHSYTNKEQELAESIRKFLEKS